MSSGNSDSNNSTNPFIRFRHHVDANIHAGFSSLTNLSRGSSSSGSASGDGNDTTDTNPAPNNTDLTIPTNRGPNNNMSTNSGSNDTTTPHQALTLNLLTPQQAQFESRLSSFQTGGSNSAAQANKAWHLFLSRSAYSPLRLEYEHAYDQYDQYQDQYHDYSLQQQQQRDRYRYKPVPRDLPEGCDPSEFGWLEAFEDLLRVKSGLGVMDLRERARERREGFFGFLGGGFPFSGFPFGGLLGSGGFFGDGDDGFWGGSRRHSHRDDWMSHHPRHHHGVLGHAMGFAGEGMRCAAWLGRMEELGLREVLFPVYDARMGYQSPRTMDEWVERRRFETRKEEDMERLWDELTGEGTDREEARRELEKEAEEARNRIKRELDAWRDAGQETANSFFDGIGGIVRTLGKVLEDEAKSLQRFGKTDEDNRDPRTETSAANKKDSTAPETENDLYSVIQSTFHESERSLSNFFKSVSEAWRDRAEPRPASPPKIDTKEVVENGITKRTTKKEFVDDHGNTHTKTEITWTDEDGRVVMRQVHSSMGRSQHWEKTFPDPDTTQDDKQTDEKPKEQQKKEGGWFWK